jgi:thiamine-phosphate pyrophosphorylase
MGTLDRMRLARQAVLLNERARAGLPPLVLMTDDERLADPLAAARLLPRGSMVIVRARQASHRAKLAVALRPITRVRRMRLLVANDAKLAERIRADGVHLAEAKSCNAASMRMRHPGWLITMSAHSLRGCSNAARLGVDAVFLSPVYPTASHPNGHALGVARARSIARHARLPVYALGGLNARTVRRLAESPFAGMAAIGALMP